MVKTISCIIFVLFGITSPISFSQTRVFTSADPSEAPNGEMILFKIKIENENQDAIGDPVFPAWKDWELVRQYKTPFASTSIINGRVSHKRIHEHSYVLKPLKAGTISIPAAEILVGKRVFSSEPIRIRVGKVSDNPQAPPSTPPDRFGQGFGGFQDDPFESLLGQLRPQMREQAPTLPQETINAPSGESFFLRAAPDKTTAYQGELITLSFMLYQRALNLSDFEFAKFPSFRGFLKEELLSQQSFQPSPVAIKGERFFRTELIRFALFPLEVGSLTVDPMMFRATMHMSPEDIIRETFMGRPRGIPGEAVPQEKLSAPFAITVKALPPIPNDLVYSGAVGNYEVKSEVTKVKGKARQPLTLELTIEGKGNVKSIEAPQLPMSQDLELIDVRSSYEFRPNATGYKKFSYLIQPQAEGKKRIESINWTYFDPSTSQYRTIALPSFDLEIEAGSLAGPVGQADAPPSPQLHANYPASMRTCGRNEPSCSWIQTSTLVFQAGAWIFMLLWIGGDVRRLRREHYLNYHPWERTAQFLLSHNQLPNDKVFELLDRWSREYLVGQLPHNPWLHHESTRVEFLSALDSMGCTYETRKSLADHWAELDRHRFSGTQLIDHVNIRKELEKTRAIFILKDVKKI